MRKILAAIALAAALVLGAAGAATANPSAPTNGGSANGAGQSGQCTGAEADRPAACHNGNGAGN
jgi:opacity protein-like surface antigen